MNSWSHPVQMLQCLQVSVLLSMDELRFKEHQPVLSFYLQVQPAQAIMKEFNSIHPQMGGGASLTIFTLKIQFLD